MVHPWRTTRAPQRKYLCRLLSNVKCHSGTAELHQGRPARKYASATSNGISGGVPKTAALKRDQAVRGTTKSRYTYCTSTIHVRRQAVCALVCSGIQFSTHPHVPAFDSAILIGRSPTSVSALSTSVGHALHVSGEEKSNMLRQSGTACVDGLDDTKIVHQSSDKFRASIKLTNKSCTRAVHSKRDER